MTHSTKNKKRAIGFRVFAILRRPYRRRKGMSDSAMQGPSQIPVPDWWDPRPTV